jgi:hypothetical protein
VTPRRASASTTDGCSSAGRGCVRLGRAGSDPR